MDTDADLLARLRAGDEGAFVALVGRYHQPLLRLASTIAPSRAVAEEAVQDTWMGVVRGVDRFEGRSSFKNWLYRILVNRTRTASGREPFDAPLDALHSVDPTRFDPDGQWAEPVDQWVEDSDARLDAAAWAPVLAAALADLSPRQRQIVLLRDVDGVSSDDACAILGISAGNQRILLHRGRARLRETLDEKMEKE